MKCYFEKSTFYWVIRSLILKKTNFSYWTEQHLACYTTANMCLKVYKEADNALKIKIKTIKKWQYNGETGELLTHHSVQPIVKMATS